MVISFLSTELPIIVLLVVIAFFSGIGITTIGPGGIFVTIALYSLTSIPSGKVAGTAHATFIATGLIGSWAYLSSGEMKSNGGYTVAINLSATSVIGAFAGAYANTYVSRAAFGMLLGGVTIVIGGVILFRERQGFAPIHTIEITTLTGQFGIGILGVFLGFCSGLLGIGGPVLAVPTLILFGIPMLNAVAVAQIQSIFIAMFATTGYLLQGNVSLSLAFLIAPPLLVGVIVGWKVAHLVDPTKMRVILGVALIVTGTSLIS